MSAAESLSVGSVASLGSQDGGISQTSAALSTHHGSFGAPAAFSTTQPTVVSNANETALSAVREGYDNDQTSEEQHHAPTVRSESRHEVDGMTWGVGEGGGGYEGMAMGGAGGYVMDSTMAAMLSSVGNEAGSTVSQALQGESAVSERSVNKGRRGVPRRHGMNTRFGDRMSGRVNPALNTPLSHTTQPAQHHDTVVDHNGSLCSLVQSNSITSRNSGNGIDDEVESCSGAAMSSQAPSGRPLAPGNFSDIAAQYRIQQSSSTTASGIQLRRRGQTWPRLEAEGAATATAQETVNGVEGSGGNHGCDAGQTSVGLVPAESITAVNQAEGSVHHHQHQASWAESNEGVETSPARQGSLSVHQPQPADKDMHFGVKRKDISFGDSNSGKRRH